MVSCKPILDQLEASLREVLGEDAGYTVFRSLNGSSIRVFITVPGTPLIVGYSTLCTGDKKTPFLGIELPGVLEVFASISSSAMVQFAQKLIKAVSEVKIMRLGIIEGYRIVYLGVDFDELLNIAGEDKLNEKAIANNLLLFFFLASELAAWIERSYAEALKGGEIGDFSMSKIIEGLKLLLGSVGVVCCWLGGQSPAG